LACRNKRKRKVPQPDYDEEEQEYSAAPDAADPPPVKFFHSQRCPTTLFLFPISHNTNILTATVMLTASWVVSTVNKGDDA
jgi:hypothetical protein